MCGKASPFRKFVSRTGEAPPRMALTRHSLKKRNRESYGKAEPFRTSGGRAATHSLYKFVKTMLRPIDPSQPAPLLLCQTFFFALFFRRLTPRRGGSFFGSPVAAFFTTPPSSSAISVNVRLVSTEYGSVSVMSSPSLAYLS